MQLAQGGELTPAFVVALKPRIVYFDSCNLGLSVAFLDALQRSGTAYLLAPILVTKLAIPPHAQLKLYSANSGMAMIPFPRCTGPQSIFTATTKEMKAHVCCGEHFPSAFTH
jgi:hypothetical protein